VVLSPSFSKIAGEVIELLFFGENLNRYEYEGENLIDATFSLLRELGAVTSGLFAFLFPQIVRMAILPEHRRVYNKIMSYRKFCESLIIERKKKFNSEEV